MGRYSVKTRLSSEEAISEAKVYFGEGGLGLVATGESSCHATLTGADGYVTVTAGEEGDKTNVELVEALRRRIAELEACSEDLGAFAHAVAHDLKAPLAVVLGFADILKEGSDPSRCG
jgi:signal transduction histidine kinase